MINLAFLQKFCLGLPAATEDVKYGSDLCFSVGGKFFFGTRLEGPFRTGIKCGETDFALLTERDGIVPMPRLSVTAWVRIEKADALTKSEWEHYIKQLYNLVIETLPKKKRDAIKVL